jgi:hypothetical protein
MLEKLQAAPLSVNLEASPVIDDRFPFSSGQFVDAFVLIKRVVIVVAAGNLFEDYTALSPE